MNRPISARPSVSIKAVDKIWTPEGRTPVEALRGLEFDVAPGEFVVLLGPSGCGKSTLLYMIAGLEGVSGGSIVCDGLPVTEPSAERGLIFQEASLFPWLTIADNVAFGLSIQGVLPVRRREIAIEMLKRVGLGDMLDKKPDELSGGMRQRAACARALAMKPKVLMMDEPFAALDVQTRSRMQDFLLQIWRDSGASILLVTHSIDEAIALADRVVVFTARPGRVKTIVPIDLPRPRPTRDPRYHEYRDMFTELLAAEVDRAFAEQEAA
ncbi:ABC transporter ATP-binding protein [Prosthecomicrobium hirschii]|uniref:ABC transporter ATP-binding protein n=1 Tax=Prosthecodimorpha hirschii TaxID=665126 RepID=A0A0P6VZF9_9HYPH|nr:ABC transporter ATP-binding protein [Prosthecomicrobium hirschii]KPL51205.1 ABC transporter ATP-binding protein [Prosthecomicrobium hirschii]